MSLLRYCFACFCGLSPTQPSALSRSSPKPFREGQFWWLRVWDTNPAGSRKRQRIKLAPADMPVREAQKIAEEKLRPSTRDWL
jgi:hypothetical protein